MTSIQYMMVLYALVGIKAIAVRGVIALMNGKEDQESAEIATAKWEQGLAELSGLIMGWVTVVLVGMSGLLWVIRQSSLPISISGWYSLAYGVAVILGAGSFIRLIPLWVRRAFK